MRQLSVIFFSGPDAPEKPDCHNPKQQGKNRLLGFDRKILFRTGEMWLKQLRDQIVERKQNSCPKRNHGQINPAHKDGDPPVQPDNKRCYEGIREPKQRKELLHMKPGEVVDIQFALFVDLPQRFRSLHAEYPLSPADLLAEAEEKYKSQQQQENIAACFK